MSARKVREARTVVLRLNCVLLHADNIDFIEDILSHVEIDEHDHEIYNQNQVNLTQTLTIICMYTL